MPDSDIAKLARDIYRKHKQALDIIIENKPDLRDEVSTMMSAIIKGGDAPFNDLKCARLSTNYFRYSHKDWIFSDGWRGERTAFKENGFSFEVNLGDLVRYNTLKVELVMGDIPNLQNRRTLHEKVYYALQNQHVNGIKNAYLKDKGVAPSSIPHRRIWTMTEKLELNTDDIDDTEKFIKATEDAWQKILKTCGAKIYDAATKAMKEIGAIQ